MADTTPPAPETTIGGFTLTNIRSTLIAMMALISMVAATYAAFRDGTPIPAPPVLPQSAPAQAK